MSMGMWISDTHNDDAVAGEAVKIYIAFTHSIPVPLIVYMPPPH